MPRPAAGHVPEVPRCGWPSACSCQPGPRPVRPGCWLSARPGVRAARRTPASAPPPVWPPGPEARLPAGWCQGRCLRLAYSPQGTGWGGRHPSSRYPRAGARPVRPPHRYTWSATLSPTPHHPAGPASASPHGRAHGGWPGWPRQVGRGGGAKGVAGVPGQQAGVHGAAGCWLQEPGSQSPRSPAPPAAGAAAAAAPGTARGHAGGAGHSSGSGGGTPHYHSGGRGG